MEKMILFHPLNSLVVTGVTGNLDNSIKLNLIVFKFSQIYINFFYSKDSKNVLTFSLASVVAELSANL